MVFVESVSVYEKRPSQNRNQKTKAVVRGVSSVEQSPSDEHGAQMCVVGNPKKTADSRAVEKT